MLTPSKIIDISIPSTKTPDKSYLDQRQAEQTEDKIKLAQETLSRLTGKTNFQKRVAKHVISKALLQMTDQNKETDDLAKAAGASQKVTLPQYNIEDFGRIKTLGKGTFGVVKLVYHLETKQLFALKILDKAKIQGDKQIQHVKNEKAILLAFQ